MFWNDSKDDLIKELMANKAELLADKSRLVESLKSSEKERIDQAAELKATRTELDDIRRRLALRAMQGDRLPKGAVMLPKHVADQVDWDAYHGRMK